MLLLPCQIEHYDMARGGLHMSGGKSRRCMPNSVERCVAIQHNLYGFGFLLPWLLGFLLFCFYPFVQSLIYSFTNYNMTASIEFVGLNNYINLVTRDKTFAKSVEVTLTYVAIGVPLQLIVALALAMVLNKGIPGLKYFRAAYYLPALMGGSVAVGILWQQVFGVNGIFNDLLKMLGFPSTVTGISWVKSPNYAVYSLILLRVWQFGSPMIIFLAGLKQVPEELYESAALDGANMRKRFIHITLPMISPIILFNLVMQIISAFQTFTSAYIVGGTTGATGGVANSLLFYTIYLYRVGFEYFKMGIASAIGWILLIIIGFFTVIVFRTSSYWVYYSD